MPSIEIRSAYCAFVNCYRHPHPNEFYLLSPKIWETRDQPEPGSFRSGASSGGKSLGTRLTLLLYANILFEIFSLNNFKVLDSLQQKEPLLLKITFNQKYSGSFKIVSNSFPSEKPSQKI
jgi:hypothetical protein